MTDFQLLDRPVWSALSTDWAQFALTYGAARRLRPEFGPFAATEDPNDLSDLVPLVKAHGAAWVVGKTAPLSIPADLAIAKHADLIQMVRLGTDLPDVPEECEPLTAEDSAEMRALALLTEPGPFAEKTHLLGPFFGIRCSGKIVAMAGERMHMPGIAEVSAVCTHPDHRGQGLSAGPTAATVRSIVQRGEVPFLHCYPSNAPAISVYERLGFSVRQSMVVMILVEA